MKPRRNSRSISLDLRVGRGEQLDLLDRDADVLDPDRDAGHRGVVEAERLDPVDQLRGRGRAELAVALRDERLEALAIHDPVDVAELLGDDRVEDHPPGGGLDQLGAQRAGTVGGRGVPAPRARP